MLRHSGLCRSGPFTTTTHLCVWACGGSHIVAHLVVKFIEIISSVCLVAHVEQIFPAIDSKNFGYVLNYILEAFVEILRKLRCGDNINIFCIALKNSLQMCGKC
jgi:hypothetical protein